MSPGPWQLVSVWQETGGNQPKESEGKRPGDYLLGEEGVVGDGGTEGLEGGAGRACGGSWSGQVVGPEGQQDGLQRSGAGGDILRGSICPTLGGPSS